MAAIDSLLRVMVLRDAEAIILTTGKPPSLRRRGTIEVMSMPPIDAAMMNAFVDDVVTSDEQRATLDSKNSIEVSYQPSDGGACTIAVERTSMGHKLVARLRAVTKVGPSAVKDVAPVEKSAAKPTSGSSWWASAPAAAPVVAHQHQPGDASRTGTISMAMRTMITAAIRAGASDLIVSAGAAPRMRVDGELRSMSSAPVDADDIHALTGEAFDDSHGSHDIGLDVAPDDGHGDERARRVRVNVFAHHSGVAAAIRILRDDMPSLDELGLPPEIASLITHRDGLVLVCGPTGSGKSTTLAALIEQMNRTRDAHIISLEDPIEHRFISRSCLIHQRQVGRDVPSFADGLRAALRESPDVIVVGELRDAATISTALTAAETGHLVLATLHAPSAAVAIDRLVDSFAERQARQVRAQLAAVLRVVVSQHLVPRRTGGRAVAIEYAPITAAIANLIRKGELHQLASTIQTGRDQGMITLERHLAKLVKDQIITSVVARRAAQDVEQFDAALRG